MDSIAKRAQLHVLCAWGSADGQALTITKVTETFTLHSVYVVYNDACAWVALFWVWVPVGRYQQVREGGRIRLAVTLPTADPVVPVRFPPGAPGEP